MEAAVFCKLMLNLISHHFDCILVSRGKLLGPGHTQGEGITQECKYQETDSPGAILETANHI